MQQTIIKKSPADWKIIPNVSEYPALRTAFSWDAIRDELAGLPDHGGINIAYEAVDRHAAGAYRDKIALRWLDREGLPHDYSYGRLRFLASVGEPLNPEAVIWGKETSGGDVMSEAQVRARAHALGQLHPTGQTTR
jgi:hypothetical protein